MKARALGRLLRLSLFPSAAADVVAGALLAAGAWPPVAELGLLLAAALGLYHGGMALNDWADRHEDARLRPARPLPSGALGAPLALALGLGLLALGVAAAFRIDPRTGSLAAGIALLVLLYDLGPRGPLLGPLLLAAARAGNLALGMLAGASLLQSGSDRHGNLHLPAAALAAAALTYGGYVFVVSRLGRLEDAAEPPAPGRTRRLLRTAALLLLAVPLVPAAVSALPRLLPPFHAPRGMLLEDVYLPVVLVVLASLGLFGAARRDPREPADIVAAMGLALRRLLVATASLALLAGNPGHLGALCILAGYPLSHALRRVFPPS